jgi:sugar phosphate isomerase/epimerase
MTRRTLLSTMALASAAAAGFKPRVEWKPKLGILGHYTPANVEFAHSLGYTNFIPTVGPGDTLDAARLTDAQIDQFRVTLQRNAMSVSALGLTVNHTDPDPGRRARINSYTRQTIELAGRLGVPNIGTMSGKDTTKNFPAQVDEIVRVYHEQYFELCQRHKVRLCWEPWPEGPNVATSPAGYHALFKAFGDTPYVGLQFDPSHFVRQFMDPLAIAREFVSYIYDVHLKDVEILDQVLKAGGIHPVNGASWWRYRIPGLGCIRWNEFFSILQEAGYQGAMSVEHEDALYGDGSNPGPDFSEDYKVGFLMAKRYLAQYVP